ncbi:MAG: hypothetical protein J6A30_03245 [Ruminococcus sp.]|nr:hypothetical protein [Ruminococcus sp.]MDD6059202.1 hypothetical protein [Ruminococcus sp.]
MANSKIDELYNLLMQDTIQIPKSLMAYDDLDENTIIMFSVVLDQCIKERWEREKFISTLENLSIETIAEECMISTLRARIVKSEMPELIADVDDILGLNKEGRA